MKRLVGDQLGQSVCDPVEERIEALLGEELVEDVRELPVGVDKPVLGCWTSGNEPDQISGTVNG